MKKLLLLSLILLAGCGGPLTLYQKGEKISTICVRDCNITDKGKMVCVTHNGHKFTVPKTFAATYNDGWALGSCSCHFHFPDVPSAEEEGAVLLD